jgi:methionine-rich copper-binding protein CopC
MIKILNPLKILLSVMGFLLLVAPGVAFAHAHLISSTPAKDAVLHQPPKEVVVQFSEALERAMCELEVKNLKTGEKVNKGEISNAGNNQSSLKTDLKALDGESGLYEVSWKAVSKDTHRMSGKYRFTLKPKAK